jgi:hypothetical protein
MMCMGKAVENPHVEQGIVRHIDLCSTMAALLGGPPQSEMGTRMPGLKF